MKNLLHQSLGCLLILAGAMAVTPARAADGEVSSPSKRQEVLDQAKKVLGPREIPTAGPDPFHSESFRELVDGADHPAGTATGVEPDANAAKPAGPLSARDRLRAIAEGLKPSGSFVMGGKPTLVFGQKLVRAGGFLTVTFEGTDYTVEISAIELPNFTLRLNREEFTRPIK
jgi:hypothetical protein